MLLKRYTIKQFRDSIKLKDIFWTIAILTFATIFNEVFLLKESDFLTIALVFILAVVTVARITTGYPIAIVSCFIVVLFDNYFFTKPYNSFDFTSPTYPLAFLSMLLISLVICTMTSQLKEKEGLIINARTESMRNKLLLAISHDLRTPLTSILGATSTILENYDMISQDRRIELLTEVHEEADWLIHMVENLLYITKVQGTNTQLNKRPEIVEEILFDATRKIKKRYSDAPINLGYTEEILMVPMDALLIEQVLVNLIENSIRHGESVTRIDVSSASADGYVSFTIKDNGVGIAPELLPHLFDGLSRTQKNNQIDSTKDFGIGLSVCKAIIDAHMGFINVTNNVDGGACFTFYLPLEEAVNE